MAEGYYNEEYDEELVGTEEDTEYDLSPEDVDEVDLSLLQLLGLGRGVPVESDTDGPTGGYDCQFVDVVPDSLQCLICTSAARIPQQLDCCGKIFCKSCLSKLRRTRNSGCPNCRSKTWKSFSDKKSDRDLKSLTVKCSNLDLSGCSWEGELRELEGHITKCSNNLQPCKFTSIGCTVKLLKQDLPSHEEECTAEHLKLAMNKITTLTKLLQPLLTLPDRLKTLEAVKALVTVPPFISTCNISQFQEPTWESAPFYSHPNGYKFYLYLNMNFGSQRVVSVDVCLMRGEHDDQLVWPFRGVIKFEMLNQIEDCNHRQGCARFMERKMSDRNRRVLEPLEKSRVGWGMANFLWPDTAEDEPFLLNGSLYILVNDIDLSDMNKPWLLE